MRTKIVNYKRDCCYQRTLSIIPPKKKESQTLVASSVQEREKKALKFQNNFLCIGCMPNFHSVEPFYFCTFEEYMYTWYYYYNTFLTDKI